MTFQPQKPGDMAAPTSPLPFLQGLKYSSISPESVISLRLWIFPSPLALTDWWKLGDSGQVR